MLDFFFFIFEKQNKLARIQKNPMKLVLCSSEGFRLVFSQMASIHLVNDSWNCDMYQRQFVECQLLKEIPLY